MNITCKAWKIASRILSSSDTRLSTNPRNLPGKVHTQFHTLMYTCMYSFSWFNVRTGLGGQRICSAQFQLNKVGFQQSVQTTRNAFSHGSPHTAFVTGGWDKKLVKVHKNLNEIYLFQDNIYRKKLVFQQSRHTVTKDLPFGAIFHWIIKSSFRVGLHWMASVSVSVKKMQID